MLWIDTKTDDDARRRGEPKAHTTALRFNVELWRKQESKLAAVRGKRRADLIAETVALARPEPIVASVPDTLRARLIHSQ